MTFCLIKNISWSNYHFLFLKARAFDLERDHSSKMKEERTQLLQNYLAWPPLLMLTDKNPPWFIFLVHSSRKRSGSNANWTRKTNLSWKLRKRCEAQHENSNHRQLHNTIPSHQFCWRAPTILGSSTSADSPDQIPKKELFPPIPIF